jgi:hypothetical protein
VYPLFVVRLRGLSPYPWMHPDKKFGWCNGCGGGKDDYDMSNVSRPTSLYVKLLIISTLDVLI